MNWIVTAAILTAILFLDDGTYLRLRVAPIENAPTGFTQLGMAIFDLQVNPEGHVDKEESLYGPPPFIEPARLSLEDWRFERGRRDVVHVNATFLFKPKLNFPDSTSVLDIPLPDSHRRLLSPFPVTIVEPGYPMGGLYGGTVVMQVAINSEGRVGNVDVISAVPTLTAAAITAVRRWKFYVPPDVDMLSRTAVVAVHFETPEFGISAADTRESAMHSATLVGASDLTAPDGAEGEITAGDSAGLAFVYGDSHWLVPYELIRSIQYVAISPEQSLLEITYSGTREQEAVTFCASDEGALATAAELSTRTGKPIQFKKSRTFDGSKSTE